MPGTAQPEPLGELVRGDPGPLGLLLRPAGPLVPVGDEPGEADAGLDRAVLAGCPRQPGDQSGRLQAVEDPRHLVRSRAGEPGELVRGLAGGVDEREVE